MKLYFNNKSYSSHSLKIKNLSNKETEFSISMYDYIKNETGELQLLTLNSTDNSCANIISFFPAIIKIDSMSEKTISIKLNKENDDGTIKWGMLIIKPLEVDNGTEITKARINIHPQIGVKIYCNNLEHKAIFESSEIIKNKNNYSIDIENTTSAFNRLNITILITNIESLEETIINKTSTEFLPNSKRKFTFQVSDSLGKGHYLIAVILKDGEDNFLLGKELLIELF